MKIFSKRNIYNILFLISIFSMPFLIALLIFFDNSNLVSENTINIIKISSFISIIVLLLSMIGLIKNKYFFTKNNYLKRIAIILFAAFFAFEEFATVSLVYYNDEFKSWLITTSLNSTNYQSIARNIYPEEEIDKVMDSSNVDLSDDIVNFSDIGYEGNIYTNKEEQELLEHDPDELYKVIKVEGTVIGTKYHYEGWLVAVYDPANVTIGISKTMEKEANINRYSSGERLTKISKDYDALVAMNAGGFHDPKFRSNGGVPHGTVIADGVVYPGHKQSPAYYEGMIGFNKDNKLVLTKHMSYEEALKSDYRDAVDFGPFLIVNGKNRYGKVKSYTWATSRTAIGQREDGTVLLLVIDGNQSFSRGACFADLAYIMEKYGAVNAANLDGGTSTALTVNHKYINSPWNGKKTTYRTLPDAWIVKDNSKKG